MKLLSLLLVPITILAIGHDSSIQESASASTFSFDSDVSKVMDLLINHLYKDKESFLRELISNSADALGKIRLEKSRDSNVELAIYVDVNSDTSTLTVRDTGIGMTGSVLKANLGTIAKSGTDEMIKSLASNDTNALIGKFGVGFYSTFLVASNVQVVTKSHEDIQMVWQSDASGSYKIFKDERGDTLGRGTAVTLKLKEDDFEFLEYKRLEQLIKKNSEFINFPIYLWGKVEEEIEVQDVLKDDKLDEAKKEKEIVEKEVVYAYKLINENKSIWTRPSTEVSLEEYTEFFQSHYKVKDEPLGVAHFDLQGMKNSFKALVYIPKTAPKKFLQPDSNGEANVELFVRRVFISEIDILPKWMGFIKVIIDSDDLELNVNRESLHDVKALKGIKNKIISKTLDLLMEMDAEKYKEFHETYGKVLRYAMMEAKSKHRDTIKDLLLFKSTSNDSVSLKEYVSRMKDGQSQILYATGTSLDIVKKAALAEKLVLMEYEILVILDPFEEYLIGDQLKDYGTFKLQNVNKPGLLLGNEESSKEKEELLKVKFEPLIEFLKENLADQVQEVKVSLLLSSAPFVVKPSQMGLSPSQERVMVAQANGNLDGMTGFYLGQKRLLEFNPDHPFILKLLDNVVQGSEGLELLPLAIYEVYSVAAGYDVLKFDEFVARIQSVLSFVAGSDPILSAKPIIADHDDEEL